ncbi:MAG TPA: hypothetical protein PLL09_03690 [Flavobacterium sp.]|uniref:hypothetical protein n=1 Tax=unclassified Flavobacterium TaxID=196869 RepID=UPI0025BAB782|nr:MULTISPECIES: hypothetical protein [unclassified Flavobacterium]HRE76907.1 hypothetical protein [Flavobacterium sp.]
MPKKSNPSNENKHINKVEEPIIEYNVEKNVVQEEELHPILIKLLEKSIQDSKEGKGISHEEMQKRIKLKYPFLK